MRADWKSQKKKDIFENYEKIFFFQEIFDDFILNKNCQKKLNFSQPFMNMKIKLLQASD